MGAFRIRTIKESDRDAVIHVIRSFDPFDARLAGRTLDHYFNEEEDDEVADNKIYVGTFEGKVVAVGGYFRDYYGTRRSFWLGWFYVHPDYRNRGFGHKLLNKVERELRGKKVKKLFVETSSDRIYSHTVRLYLENGFRLEGTLRDYYTRGEDLIILGKEL